MKSRIDIYVEWTAERQRLMGALAFAAFLIASSLCPMVPV